MDGPFTIVITMLIDITNLIQYAKRNGRNGWKINERYVERSTGIVGLQETRMSPRQERELVIPPIRQNHNHIVQFWTSSTR
jgi:hypothetical protein